MVPQIPEMGNNAPHGILLLLVPQFWEEHTTIILRHMHPSHGNSTYHRNLKKKSWPVGWEVNVVP